MLRRLIARSRRRPLVRRLAAGCRRFLAAYENAEVWELGASGELDVLRAVAATNPRVLLDVGANEGEWARAALAACPGAHVHCFEVLPATAATLARALDGQARATVHAHGLGAAHGTVTLRVHPGLSTVTTMTDFVLDPAIAMATAEGVVHAGDDWLDAQGLDTVDFVKIDVEGAEGLVLEGFARSLAAGRLGAVQFEYGRASLATRVLLADLYARFPASHYEVGRIYPGYVEFRPWRAEDENFLGGNFLAVRRDRTALLAALRGA